MARVLHQPKVRVYQRWPQALFRAAAAEAERRGMTLTALTEQAVRKEVEDGKMRLGLWQVWYFDGDGRREAGDDPAIPLPDRVRAPYAIARSHVTGEYRWWSSGQWHDRRPDGWPERARLGAAAQA